MSDAATAARPGGWSRPRNDAAVASGWCWSDAWFFEAVAWAESADAGADLGQVIAAGDIINHAVLGRDEIDGAVHRLVGAGLVEVVARRFTLTARGHALRRPSERVGVYERMNWLDAQLARLPIADVDVGWTLGEDEWRTACDSYQDRFWTAYRRHSGRGRP